MNIDPISSASVTPAGAPQRLSPPNAAAGQDVTGTDFSSLIGDAIQRVATQLRQAEATSMAHMKGMASTQDMVMEVMAAEQKLQATIAVRDKIVSAYLEISRMSI
jgi:flagellar hook-basal body complex protein FliE